MVNRPDRRAFARQLRRDSTDAERLLWAWLKAGKLEGSKWRRQVPLGIYFADFYCHAARLVVELDGDQHAEPAQVEADQRRTEFLEAQGCRVLRFSNGDVLTATEAVLTVILEAMSAGLKTEPSP